MKQIVISCCEMKNNYNEMTLKAQTALHYLFMQIRAGMKAYFHQPTDRPARECRTQKKNIIRLKIESGLC